MVAVIQVLEGADSVKPPSFSRDVQEAVRLVSLSVHPSHVGVGFEYMAATGFTDRALRSIRPEHCSEYVQALLRRPGRTLLTLLCMYHPRHRLQIE